MIRNTQSLDMSEVKKVLGGLADTDKKEQLESFIKKFSKISPGKAEELKKELNELGLIKLKQEHIIKIIDLLPEDAPDLNKIFVDLTLDEEEANKILEVVKKYG